MLLAVLPIEAVTVAVTGEVVVLGDRVTTACPLPLVSALVDESVPAVVEKATITLGRVLPF